MRASLAQGREFRPFFVLGAPVNRQGRFSGHGLKTAGQFQVSLLLVVFKELLGDLEVRTHWRHLFFFGWHFGKIKAWLSLACFLGRSNHADRDGLERLCP